MRGCYHMRLAVQGITAVGNVSIALYPPLRSVHHGETSSTSAFGS